MITDVRASKMYLLLHQGESVASVSKRLEMSQKTVRKYRDAGQLPSQIERPQRNYRTRKDPLAEFWSEIEGLLQQDARLKPYAILDWLKQKYNSPPGEPRVTDTIRRSLERRVQRWKLQHGIEQDVKFTQVHHAGDVLAFDFVVTNSLKVTINKKPLDHMLFHSVFTYSNWEYVHLCRSESFEALSAGLQDALHLAGGVPGRVRSDSLSAAVNNLSDDKEFAVQYRELLAHYGTKGHRINVRKPHENGDVESSHGHFKDALDQALRLRGSRDFTSEADYMTFVRQLVTRRNSAREKRFAEELAVLSPLPPQRRSTCTSMFLTVKSDSVIRVKRNAYSVSSKYIGLYLEVRIHQDHLELWYRSECLERMPRQFGYGKEAIDFRHVIDSLVRKPGAFINYKYVNHMYPTTRFRMAYDQLLQGTTEKSAVKQYLKLLHAAKHEGLELVDATLRWFLAEGKAISADDVLEVVARGQQLPAPTALTLDAPDLSMFDCLLQHKEMYDDQETDLVNWQNSDDENEQAGDGLAAYDRYVEAAGSTERIAASDLPGEPTVDRRASGPRSLDAHPVPGGVGGQGMPGATPRSHPAADAQCQSADREDLGSVQLVSAASAHHPAIRDLAQWGLLESAGQLVDFRETGFWKDDAVVSAGRSTGQARSIGVLLDVPDVGARVVASQTRSSTGTLDQEAQQVRGFDHRRPGLRPTEPGGDGGAIHSARRTLRKRQRAAQFESAVLKMGADLQGPDDNGRCDRPTDSPQRDRRAKHPQLQARGSQAETTQINSFKGCTKQS